MFSIRLPLAIGCLMLVGCAVNSYTARQKGDSLSGLTGAEREEARAILEPALHNSAVLFSGWENVSVDAPKGIDPWSESTAFVVSTSFRPGRVQGWSTAVPVTADGYFLTAAHSVEDSRGLKILAPTKGEGFVVRDVRVVWSGVKRNPDFALIHAPMRTWSHLTLKDPAKLPERDLIVISGWGGMGDPGVKPGPAQAVGAGSALFVSSLLDDRHSDARYRIILHDAPISSGDSGGPLLSAAGFHGINSHGVYRPAFLAHRLTSPIKVNSAKIGGYHGVAYAPDPGWLKGIIRKDRAR